MVLNQPLQELRFVTDENERRLGVLEIRFLPLKKRYIDVVEAQHRWAKFTRCLFEVDKEQSRLFFVVPVAVCELVSNFAAMVEGVFCTQVFALEANL